MTLEPGEPEDVLDDEEEEDQYVPPEWLTPEHQRLRYLVREYYRAQRARIRSGHYIKRLKNRGIEPGRLETFHQDFRDMHAWEARRRREIQKALEQFPLWTDGNLARLRGIGPILGGGWIGELGPADRFPHPSALWRYCGQGVGQDGWRERAMDGDTRRFSRHLKTLAWKTGKSFVLMGGPYRDLFRERKAMEERRREWVEHRLRERRGTPPDKPVKGVQAYIDARARRWTVKLFLAHLWQRSREVAGKPITTPWIIARGGHHDLIPPPW